MTGWGARVIALLLVVASYWGAYEHGQAVKDAEWQIRWAVRDAADKQAWAEADVAERAKEQARQLSINRAIQDGQKSIDQAVADAAAARDDLRVRNEADRAASHATSAVSGFSCTAAASAAASRAVLVLADVLKRADERAGNLAADADQGRSRGMTCEKAYDSVIGSG